ncbi:MULTISPECIES: hypothetical protein [unclassified Rhizobium]|uniref:hypothetical protein n=1 Tax=unclassified Rhizobium TaxID=2613769 RepID=UPI001ADAB9E5|nr:MULTISPECIES: hypothetical protein [unclassified Rhizobium]MBO9100970.1 hypothetical protein [Rhizobium sp. L58/93]MBO9170740.1 hypothetical protein [Rhizobium sp. L245/93]MBO9186563.1 hypothetical protein [Rhizobium sp. E27B/91]QXZ86151.1 hypothetical protein J5287_24020 [Rhizobium sp. K1/93]QXZ92393.1 hypothetical protein J5280_25170 [Rhizobium sp. K15/93]
MPRFDSAVAKLKTDMRQFLILAIYLYICLSAIILYKMTIVGGSGFWPFGLPALKALLLAKFIMLGHAIKLGERYKERRLFSVIAVKVILYFGLLVLLSVIEEMVTAGIHGESVLSALPGIANGRLPQVLATSFIMVLVLIPYLASREIDAAMDGGLWRALMERRTGRKTAVKPRIGIVS